jgi:hypothetical protein
VEEKPPQQKPNGTGRESVTKKLNLIWVLTGDGSPQSVIGIQNRWFERVHARTTNPLTKGFGRSKKKNKSVDS